MGNRNICHRREIESEEFSRNPEDAFAQLFKLKIWLHFILIQIKLLFTNLLHVVTIVPWLNLDLCTFLISEGLHISHFFMHACHGWLPNSLHQFHGSLRRFLHSQFQTPMSVRGKTQQFGSLSAQLQDFCDDSIVIVLIAVISAINEHAPGLLSKIASI